MGKSQAQRSKQSGMRIQGAFGPVGTVPRKSRKAFRRQRAEKRAAAKQQ